MNGFIERSLPIAATDYAVHWDTLYYFLFYVCVVFSVIVLVPMIYFAIKYRARPGVKADQTATHNMPLEFLWTAIPTFIVMAIFAWGWIVYKELIVAPRDAQEVRVVAQSWAWTFQYEDGRTTTNQLFVPVNQPIKLTITAKKTDVLHAFFVPNFRIKKDAVPGAFSHLWFTARIPGQHQIFCAEYCGTGHSAMLAKLIVLDEEQWKLWKWGKEFTLPPPVGIGSVGLVSAEPPTKTAALTTPSSSLGSDAKLDVHSGLALQGQKVLQSKGCTACHSDDGSKKIGPSYKGIFGKMTELTDGSKIMVDENYIAESLDKPQAKIVKGFEKMVMPSYEGQLSAAEINAVIAYIKSLN